MVRQYIGARYVPKFTGEYDATLAYEPLSIVQVGNNFYTSKIPVPAGTPVTNTAYWVLTGNLNGSIVDLEERMSAVEARYPRRKYYMPEMFGGRTDDTTIDNSPAIRQCIDAAKDEGGVILFSAGIYYCATPIQINYKTTRIKFYGTGDSYTGSAPGTILQYTGYGDFLTFNNSFHQGSFTDITFVAVNAGTSCIKFTDEAEANTRTFETKFENVSFCFRTIGAWIGTAAYVIFDNCNFRGDVNNSDQNRIGLYLGGLDDLVNQDIEYVSLINCRISLHGDSEEEQNLNSNGILIDRGTHVTLYHVDITDCDNGIYLNCRAQIGFFDTYSCDFARCHNAIMVNIQSNSLTESSHYSPVFTGTGAETDRILNVHKTSGGGAYGARVKILNYSVRAGLPGVWFESDSNTGLYPGSCEFTNANGSNDTARFAIQQPRLATLGTRTAAEDHITGDFNDYTNSGFVPLDFKADSTNGPGFDCFLLVFVANAYIAQVAIGNGSTAGIAKRTYNRTTNAWSAWQTYAPA